MELALPLFIGLQAVGALLGAIATVRGEIAYVRASSDGHLDRAEREHLRHIASGLKVGMSLALCASLALVILAYVSRADVQPALLTNYWAFMVLALLVTLDSWALSRKYISFPFGAALLFTGWWFLVYLTFGLLPPMSLGALVISFVVITAIFNVLLTRTRTLFTSTKQVRRGLFMKL